MMIRKLILFVVVLALFNGCATKKVGIVEAYNQGKTIINIPVLYDRQDTATLIVWKKADENGHLSDDGYNLFRSVGSSRNYVPYGVFPIDNGVYSLNKLQSYMYYKKNLSWKAKSVHNSTIGNITIIKTPEKDHNDKSIVSRYEMEYIFADNANNKNIINPITLEFEEIVMLPSLKASIVIDENTCQRTDEYYKKDGILDFIGKVIDVIDRPSNLLLENARETWEWSCPIKAIEIYIRHGSKEELKAHMRNNNIIPESMIDKIVVRDFELGDRLKNIKPEVLCGGTLKYVIKGYD